MNYLTHIPMANKAYKELYLFEKAMHRELEKELAEYKILSRVLFSFGCVFYIAFIIQLV